MSTHRRRKMFVDAKVQGALLFRVVMYWCYCLLGVTCLLACWSVFTVRPETSAELLKYVCSQYGPALAATLLLLPIVLLDCIRLSNRFVGPIFRVRRAVKQLANGEDIPPLKFRQGDFWYEFAQDFNTALLKQNRSVQSAAEAEPPATNNTLAG